MQKVNTITIDLAKNVFQVRTFSKEGKTIANLRLNRDKLKSFLLHHPATTVVMEACMSSHYWGRLCGEYGHCVKLIPAQHVKPFVRGNKNDKNDCLAIFEASQRPNIRFVPVKTEQQQGILCLHRVRERLITQRTRCINQTRSLLLEFGYCCAQGHKAFIEELSALLKHDVIYELRFIIEMAQKEIALCNARLLKLETHLKKYITQHTGAQIIQSILGIGVINASAFSAALGNGQAFNNPKDFAVWLGLTPLQYASGETSRMSGITKRGDAYLRKQLIHGARTVVNHAHKKDDALNTWVTTLVERRGKNKAVVATAHKLARLMWILLQKQESYKTMPQQTA